MNYIQMKKIPNLLFVGGRNRRSSQAAIEVLEQDQRCYLRYSQRANKVCLFVFGLS